MAKGQVDSNWPRENPEQRARREKTASTPARERGSSDVYQAISQHRSVAAVSKDRQLTERMDTARHAAHVSKQRRGAR